jgi:hypothetical protein
MALLPARAAELFGWSEERLVELQREQRSRVNFEIRRTAPSRLTLTHDGFAPAARFSRPAAARTEQTGGWPALLANLKTLLETGDALPPTPATTAAPGQAAW